MKPPCWQAPWGCSPPPPWVPPLPACTSPATGSAPKYAGLDKANPIATILSVAMMFKYSLNLPTEAQAIEDAVDAVLAEGWHTYDIPGSGEEVGTRRWGSSFGNTCKRLSFSKMTVFCRSTA